MSGSILTLAALLSLLPALAVAVPVDGLLSLTPVEESSYIAVRVALPDSVPVGGLRWVNNDDQTVFPRLLIAAADAEGRPDLAVSVSADSTVSGTEQDWSEVVFAEPIINRVGDVFAVFRLPEYEAISESGVGPGLGYRLEAGGPTAYLSSDGVSWTRVGAGVRILFEPVPGVNKGLGGGVVLARPEPPSWTTALSRPAPNPFNPSTKLAFTLRRAGEATLSIYNLRGQRVRTLLQGRLDAGPHEAIWRGRNDRDERVASGAYFVRLESQDGVMNRRLMLLK